MSDAITWDDIHRLIRRLDIPGPRRLECGTVAWEILRNVASTTTEVLGLSRDHLGALGLYGIPVHVDQGMPDGAWRVMEAGEVASWGDFAPGHRRAVFVPDAGLIFGFSDEIAALMDGTAP